MLRQRSIRVDESTDIRIVVSGLEVVQTGLLETALAIRAKTGQKREEF